LPLVKNPEEELNRTRYRATKCDEYADPSPYCTGSITLQNSPLFYSIASPTVALLTRSGNFTARSASNGVVGNRFSNYSTV
jgi:hypothetical protein